MYERTHLTGCCLLVLAMERLGCDVQVMTNAVNRLSPHGDPRNPQRATAASQPFEAIAQRAVQMADIIIAELDNTYPDSMSGEEVIQEDRED